MRTTLRCWPTEAFGSAMGRGGIGLTEAPASAGAVGAFSPLGAALSWWPPPLQSSQPLWQPSQPPQIDQPPHEANQPHQQQRSGQREKPQELRLDECGLAAEAVPKEDVHPFRSRLTPGVASGCVSRSPNSMGASIWNSSIFASGGGAPGRP